MKNSNENIPKISGYFSKMIYLFSVVLLLTNQNFFKNLKS